MHMRPPGKTAYSGSAGDEAILLHDELQPAALHSHQGCPDPPANPIRNIVPITAIAAAMLSFTSLVCKLTRAHDVFHLLQAWRPPYVLILAMCMHGFTAA